MDDLDIKEQFLGRFAQPLTGAAKRRIVVWHDASGEFEEDFDAMASEAADGFAESFGNGQLQWDAAGSHEGRAIKFLKIEDGSMFSSKRELSREDTSSDFALYRRRASGDIAGDMFADIELYAEHFQADGLSLLIQSLGAADSTEVRQTLTEMRPFFAAKDRVNRFLDIMPSAQSSTDVCIGVIAASLGKVKPVSQEMIRAFAIASMQDAEDGEPGKTIAKFERYGALDALKSFIQNSTGYTGDLADADRFIKHLLLSAFSATVADDLLNGLEGQFSEPHGNHCLGIVHDWMEGDASMRRVLEDASERVQDELNLAMRLENAPISSYLHSDIFSAANKAIIRDLATSLSHGADRRDDVREAISVRSGLSDYAPVSCYYDALEAASAMQDFIHSHSQGYHEAPASNVWKAYTDDWYKMDSAYRHFCVSCRKCALLADSELSEVMDALAEQADNQYINGFLIPANECWVANAEKDWEREGYVDKIPRQRRFYDEIVENELAGAKRVVVVISDALRYEVACELAERLEQTQKVAADTGSVQGAFPSTTMFGMAALLPHKSMESEFADGLAVSVDGAPTATTKQREAVLRKRRDASIAVTAKELMAMKTIEQKELTKDAEVIYIYHNSIDAVGEDAASEHDVFKACDDAIDQIGALVRIATNQIKASRIVITADHGFLYTQSPVPEADKLSQGDLKDSAACVGERYIVVPQGADDDVLVNMSMEDVGGGELAGLAPRGFVRINRPGGVSHYAHGGISLEELCVPVIRVRHGGSKSSKITDASFAEIQLLSTNRRITSMRFGVDLFQREPIGGKIAPAIYELVLTDSVGNPVSDVRRVSANKSDLDEHARITNVRFALREGLEYRSGDAYYLVAKNQESGDRAWSEAFTVDIAFAPTIDFGF